MVISDYISIGAVVVSSFSIIVSIILYKNQKKYIKTQDDLNKLLLNKEKNEIEQSNNAFVSANVVSMGNSKYRIRVYNTGKSRANDVKISYPEKHSWFIMDDKFPMKFIDPNKSVDLPLSISLNSESKITIIIIWKDISSNEEKTNEVILTR